MAAQKPSIPKGTRDFGPIEMVRRNYIFNTVQKVFKKYGYLPLETPAMENLSTLLGKYGEEGDKLLFRVLNSGNFLSKVPDEKSLQNAPSLVNLITEKGLKYDLTVPFARYVVQHRNDITFPFKRYQIQPVWRADRPQKGRYREFFQCDVDVIGSKSLLSEVELIQITDEVFSILGINVKIKINNRKVLAGVAEMMGQADQMMKITIAIDKIDKIGIEKVNEELISSGIPPDAVDKLQPVLTFSGLRNEKLVLLRGLLSDSEIGMQGVCELEMVFDYLSGFDLKSEVEIDLSLARGLNYYTGAILEVEALDVNIGSICGGGRYDDLTGIFGLKDVSGVGISFGADRIYDVMLQSDLFPLDLAQTTRLMFVNFGKEEERFCLDVLAKVRNAGISAEIYPDHVKMKKQMSYANNKNVEFVAMVGENEMAEGKISLKNMESGEQEKLSVKELIAKLSVE
ncbi:MAG: histidine--tRNA ligase [Bacteroidales bacterium]|nr:histidine--tRNA ligase [Bacteroidales bacterium]